MGACRGLAVAGEAPTPAPVLGRISLHSVASDSVNTQGNKPGNNSICNIQYRNLSPYEWSAGNTFLGKGVDQFITLLCLTVVF